MKVIAKLNNLRVAPRKSKIVTDFIKGMDALEAMSQLDATIRRSSEPVRKLLASAIANAENNFGLSKDNLFVYDAVVGAGPTLKRWMPKAFGRAGRILKRTSNITIVLEERIEGKDRKSKDEMEKEKAARMKKKDQELKNAEKEKADEKDVKKEKTVEKEEKLEKGNKGVAKSWTNKIFRRKSM